MDTRSIGDLGERIAESFLILKGYEILRRNYRYAGREIDLLARRRGVIVAVEVKLRRASDYGQAVEAIDRRKLRRIQEALAGAIAHSDSSLRPQVDVIVIDFDRRAEQMTLRHIEAVY